MDFVDRWMTQNYLSAVQTLVRHRNIRTQSDVRPIWCGYVEINAAWELDEFVYFELL